MFNLDTPWKNQRLEPENHVIEKECHLPKLHFCWFHANFHGDLNMARPGKIKEPLSLLGSRYVPQVLATGKLFG